MRGGGATPSTDDYIFYDGQLIVPITARPWCASDWYQSSYAGNNGSVNISNKNLILHRDSGNPGFITFISDPIDVTNINSISMTFTVTLNSYTTMYLGMTAQFQNLYSYNGSTVERVAPNASPGIHTVNTASIQGQWRLFFCCLFPGLYSATDMMQISEIKINR